MPRNLAIGTILFIAIVALLLAFAGINALGSVYQNQNSTATTIYFNSTNQTTTTVGQYQLLHGAFTYSPIGQVKIDYVHAILTPSAYGWKRVSFVVNFTNTGLSPIYVVAGCGSPLTSYATSGGAIVQRVQGGPRCLCAEGLTSMQQDTSSTAIDPGCWSGYSYMLMGSGTFYARINLFWSSSNQFGQGSNVTIDASFTAP